MALKLSRRHFLKGIGATGLTASLLSSRVARGQTDRAPLRVVLIPLIHGWGRDLLLGRALTGSEFDFTIPDPLKGLAPIKDQCVFVDGARGVLWGNAHDASFPDILTAAVPWNETSSTQLGSHFPEPMGPSLDHVIATHHNSRSLRLSARYRAGGRRSSPISFDENGRVLDAFLEPWDAFDAIIGPIRDAARPPAPGQDAMREELAAAMRRDADRMLGQVRGDERLKLEGYVQAFHDLGERLRRRASVVLAPDQIPDRPTPSGNFAAMVDGHLDLIHLVFRADTHRAAVLGLGEGADDWQWRDKQGRVQTGNPWGSEFHNNVAHHGPNHMDAERARSVYDGWVDWHVQKVVAFTQRLAMTPDVDGKTLLDNTLIMLTGEVGTGNHDTRNKLHVLIGGGDRLRRGRWLKAPLVGVRARDGVFIGGQKRDGERIESELNHGEAFSGWHTADVLAEIGRLAGVPLPDGFGLAANNLAPVPLRLTSS